MTSPPRLILHIVPAAYWEASDETQPYEPEPFEREGFTHTTDGAQNLADVANRYYRSDPGAFVALVIDTKRVTAPIRYDDGSGIYPHIYGPLDREAIVAVVPVPRDEHGVFLPPDLGAANFGAANFGAISD